MTVPPIPFTRPLDILGAVVGCVVNGALRFFEGLEGAALAEMDSALRFAVARPEDDDREALGAFVVVDVKALVIGSAPLFVGALCHRWGYKSSKNFPKGDKIF